MFKQEIGIPVSINPHPYWINLFLYLFESKYVQQLISKGYPCSYKFHGRCRFMDGLCTINNDRVFSSSYKYLDTKQLELKLQHQEKDKTFLDLDISAEDIYLYISFWIKGTSSLSLLYVCHISRAMFHHQYSMDQYFQSSYK